MTKRTSRLCSIEGCSNAHIARGYCSNHYQAARATGEIELLPNAVHRLSEIDEDQMLATCEVCGPSARIHLRGETIVCFKRWRELGDRKSARRKAIDDDARERRNAYHRDYLRHAMHGLERGAIASMLEAAGSCCEICGSELTLKTSRVDHDHDCCPSINGGSRNCGRCIRGILCNSCNTGLGHLGDNSAGVGRALAYLLRAEQRLALRAVS